MSQRRWIEERRWEVDGIWRVAAGSRTDAEVLAEMGTEALEAELLRRKPLPPGLMWHVGLRGERWLICALCGSDEVEDGECVDRLCLNGM